MKIKVEEFAHLSNAVTLFADRADAIGGGSGTATQLRNEIADQAKQYLNAMHTKHMESLASLLDSELWRQSDVGAYAAAAAAAAAAPTIAVPAPAVVC